jgi:hypothetical protein
MSSSTSNTCDRRNFIVQLESLASAREPRAMLAAIEHQPRAKGQFDFQNRFQTQRNIARAALCGVNISHGSDSARP